MPIQLKDRLLKQLRDFGLNPQEWRLFSLRGKTTIQLIHDDDPNFQLLGVIDWPNQCWKSLDLRCDF